MKSTIRCATIAILILSSACTIEKKEDAAVADTTAATIVIPAPAPVTPLPAPTARDTSKTSPAKKPVPRPAKTPTAGGERDSAVQPIMGIGADGKIKPIKK